MDSSGQFHFPRWSNLLLPAIGVLAVTAPIYLITLVGYGASPATINVGYRPEQPVEFSHAIHVGELGMDCRYCHTTVEQAAFAAIPPTATCMSCHTNIHPKSIKLLKVRESYQTGQPIEWVKVHDLPDYAYFDHAAHVNKGVSCLECHGRIDRMEVVHQAEELSMGWCLDCHRDPTPSIRPRGQVTNMEWDPAMATDEEQAEIERIHKSLKSTRQLTDCSTCHR